MSLMLSLKLVRASSVAMPQQCTCICMRTRAMAHFKVSITKGLCLHWPMMLDAKFATITSGSETESCDLEKNPY